ncbi:uncharacterized protein [Anabrus simplex]|uniref:uncharacterized protein n=1 Tax=Anabrus simplex TaxID=316456 RepID=UPI0034DD2D9B
MRAAKFLLLLLLATGTIWAEEEEVTATVGEGTDKTTTDDCPTCGLDYYIAGDMVKEKWIYVDTPRCCSDCTYVSHGWKCKEKTCLLNCPWAVSSAPRASFFLSLQTVKEIICSIVNMELLAVAFS